MADIREIPLTDETAERLIALSRAWAEEGCCSGMVENTRQDLREPVFAALEGETIVGYAFGRLYTQEKRISGIPLGSPCFELDELYVLPAYRDQGIGGRLFAAAEAWANPRCRFITLATSAKDYRRVLKFYAELNGMDFHSAFLTKALPGD